MVSWRDHHVAALLDAHGLCAGAQATDGEHRSELGELLVVLRQVVRVELEDLYGFTIYHLLEMIYGLRPIL